MKLMERRKKNKRWWAVLILITLMWSCHEVGNHQYDHQKYIVSEEMGYTRGDESVHEPGTNSGESYSRIQANQFLTPLNAPLSTFSIDVDQAAYTNVERFVEQGQLPPKDAVRIEEMINYFNYDYPIPDGDHPFAFKTEVATCPWNSAHQLVHIGIQGKPLNYEVLSPSNLVFLVDASGSMTSQNKLPLLKQGLSLLVNELGENDRVAIVAYAGSAGLVLPSTPASEKAVILNALDQIKAGGSTAGGQGIELAYQIAKENLIDGGNNRVILATDGDFNVGVSSPEALIDLIKGKQKDDIYLTICGFGMGNYKDDRMEMISNAGNGNYFYIDDFSAAHKVFVKEMRANLFTIAKDVKIQVEFNPRAVAGYRLIGYENRILNDEDFSDDQKDAGELGAGHTVTALYEVIPANGHTSKKELTFQNREVTAETAAELMTLKFRYKPIGSKHSNLISTFIHNRTLGFNDASNGFKFSAAVASYGMLLRDSEFKGEADYTSVIQWAKMGLGKDQMGYRSAFIDLVNRTAEINASLSLNNQL